MQGGISLAPAPTNTERTRLWFFAERTTSCRVMCMTRPTLRWATAPLRISLIASLRPHLSKRGTLTMLVAIAKPNQRNEPHFTDQTFIKPDPHLHIESQQASYQFYCHAAYDLCCNRHTSMDDGLTIPSDERAQQCASPSYAEPPP